MKPRPFLLLLTLLAANAGLIGSVHVVDANGARLLELSGVTLAFIDQPALGESIASEETRLCVASTFPSEIEEG